jgi:hypothetical protein
VVLWRVGVVVGGLLLSGMFGSAGARTDPDVSLLRTHLLVTFYGNPHSAGMGILGRLREPERAAALSRQAAAYQAITSRRVVPAYHLVAVVAQPLPGADRTFRRRESTAVIEALLRDGRANGFHLVLDVQPGRARLLDELVALEPFLAQPDVHLAVDPEFAMSDLQVPGRELGHMMACDINEASAFLSGVVTRYRLPPKVLIVHQFTTRMLPDASRIVAAPMIDVVLDMDGFGGQSLKLASYRTVTRPWRLEFTGFKIFYTIDTAPFTPEAVMQLRPLPSVVIYQ